MVLCFFIPWLAVGLATDWDLKPLIFNLLWSLTCIGGIIHALVVVSREA
ncbi:MAG: YqaE/Pmp3 family membrane protein [Crocinitomicaceae bacterium]|nr:YqaE/Pmp3 family membrane protein [Crocinitomicaceae bacterium]